MALFVLAWTLDLSNDTSSRSSGAILHVLTLMLLLLLGLRSLFLQTLLNVSDDVSCCFSTSSSRC